MLNSLLQVIHIGILGFLLSLILVSATHKLRAPDQFRLALVSYNLLPAQLALKTAKLVPWIEISLVIFALLTFALQMTVATALVLLSLYGAYAFFLSFATITNRSLSNCGCSINRAGASVSPAILLIRNLLLLVLVAIFQLSTPSVLGALPEWLMGVVFSLLLFITYSSIDGLLENHTLLKTLRLRHD